MQITSSIVCPLQTPLQPLVSALLSGHLVYLWGGEQCPSGTHLPSLAHLPHILNVFSQASNKYLNFVYIKVIFIPVYECVTITL